MTVREVLEEALRRGFRGVRRADSDVGTAELSAANGKRPFAEISAVLESDGEIGIPGYSSIRHGANGCNLAFVHENPLWLDNVFYVSYRNSVGGWWRSAWYEFRR